MLMHILASSPPTWLWPLFVGSLVAAVLVLAISRRRERRRTEALSQAASQHGLSFEGESASLATAESGAIHLFNIGHHRQSRNVMRGTSGGMDLVLFDYRYVTGSGKSQSTHEQTVAAFRVPGANLPGFELRHETMVEKIASVFGYQDIDFPDHAEFSRRYLLRGKDENAVRAAFSPALIDFFEQLAAGEKWWGVEGAGDSLVVFQPAKRAKPEELTQFIQETTIVASQFRQTGAAKFGW